MSEQVNLSEKLQKMSENLMAQCRNMDVDVKTWNFAVGKVENEFIVEVNLKLGISQRVC